MPRRKPAPVEPFISEDTSPRITVTSGKQKHEARLVDPHTPLPGAIKPVKDQRPKRRAPGETAAARQVYDDYLSALVKNRGNRVLALMDTLGIGQMEAEEKTAELHARILEAAPSTGRSFVQTLKSMDISRDARLMILREHMYSDNPAASLKAVDMVNDLEGDSNLGNEGSYESYLRLMGIK